MTISNGLGAVRKFRHTFIGGKGKFHVNNGRDNFLYEIRQFLFQNILKIP